MSRVRLIQKAVEWARRQLRPNKPAPTQSPTRNTVDSHKASTPPQATQKHQVEAKHPRGQEVHASETPKRSWTERLNAERQAKGKKATKDERFTERLQRERKTNDNNDANDEPPHRAIWFDKPPKDVDGPSPPRHTPSPASRDKNKEPDLER